MLDMWTDVFASPGWRTTGNAGGQFPRHPARLERDGPCRDSRTSPRQLPTCGSSGAPRLTGRRTTTRCTRFRRVQVTPLSRLGQAPEPVDVKSDPTVDMKTPPMMQADTMPRSLLHLRGRIAQLPPISPHRSAHPRADEAHRHRTGKSFEFDSSTQPYKALESCATKPSNS